MLGIVRRKLLYLFCSPKQKVGYAACGCDFAKLDKVLSSSHHPLTFSETNFIPNSLLPIAAPRCLFPHVVMLTLLWLNKFVAVSKMT